MIKPTYMNVLVVEHEREDMALKTNYQDKDDQIKFGIALAVGPCVDSLREGDNVVFKMAHAVSVFYDGVEHYIVDDTNIVGIIPTEEML